MRLILRLLAASLACIASCAAFAQSAIYYQSMGTDWVGQGQQLLGRSPQWAFQASHVGGSELTITMSGPGGVDYQFHIASNSGDLAAGPYEETYRTAFRGPANGLDFFGNGRGCDPVGRFVVLESELGPGNTVVRFAANFMQRCEDSADPLFGEVRFNSAIPLTVDVPQADSVPDPFLLQAQSPVRAGSWVRSNTISVYGINTPTSISVTGGEYSVNGGSFRSSSGTVGRFDQVVARVRASPTAGGTAQATLTIGGTSASLDATTYSPGTSLTGLYYRSPAGEYIGGGQERFYASPRISMIPSVAENEVSVSWEAMEGAWGRLKLVAPGKARLTAGTYEDAARTPFESPSLPRMDLTMNGNGCNQTVGRFVVHEIAYTSGGEVERLSVDLEQRCETSSAPLLVAELRYNSSTPLSALAPSAAQQGRLTNLAGRARIMTGDDVAIAGFIIGGSTNKTVMVRARGPSLAAHGVSDPLLNPTLQLFRSSDGAPVATNDDWGTASNALAVEWTGKQPTDTRESALLISLPPGGYTAVVSGAGGTQGVGLVEVFEIAQPEVPLTNIATRARIGTGDNVLIGGFIIEGDDPKTVLLRGRGPSLAQFGLADTLANPLIQLFRQDQSLIGGNDDWQQEANAAAIQASGFAPSDAAESAMLVTLPPGGYTVVMSGVGGTSGVGIVEVFAVP